MYKPETPHSQKQSEEESSMLEMDAFYYVDPISPFSFLLQFGFRQYSPHAQTAMLRKPQTISKYMP